MFRCEKSPKLYFLSTTQQYLRLLENIPHSNSERKRPWIREAGAPIQKRVKGIPSHPQMEAVHQAEKNSPGDSVDSLFHIAHPGYITDTHRPVTLQLHRTCLHPLSDHITLPAQTLHTRQAPFPEPVTKGNLRHSFSGPKLKKRLSFLLQIPNGFLLTSSQTSSAPVGPTFPQEPLLHPSSKRATSCLHRPPCHPVNPARQPHPQLPVLCPRGQSSIPLWTHLFGNPSVRQSICPPVCSELVRLVFRYTKNLTTNPSLGSSLQMRQEFHLGSKEPVSVLKPRGTGAHRRASHKILLGSLHPEPGTLVS